MKISARPTRVGAIDGSRRGRACALYAHHGWWNQGSGEAFAAPFAEDADFVAFDGERFRGREDIARFHDAEFKTHLKALA